MMKKSVIIFGVLVTLLFVGCARVASPQQTGQVIMSIQDIEPPQEYRIEIKNEETVESVMQKARAQGLTYEVKEFFLLGSLVTSINGTAQTNSMIWIYAVNGKKATQGISMQSVYPADRIEWTYEPLSF